MDEYFAGVSGDQSVNMTRPVTINDLDCTVPDEPYIPDDRDELGQLEGNNNEQTQ